MKKLVIAAAALAAGVAFADGDGIVSSTIVGYNTMTAKAGSYIALGIQFDNLSAAGGTVSVASLLDSSNLTGATSFGATMDQIWRYDSSENIWVKYGYYKASRTATPAWKKYNSSTSSFVDIGESDVVTAGDTVLFYRGGATTTVTLSGSVKAFEAKPSYSLSAGAYTFIAYPWPVAFPIADISKYYAGTGATSFGATMDQIWRYDANENMWVKYGYYKASRTATPAWKRYDATERAFVDITEEDVVPAGQGFLLYRGGATTTLTFAW